MFVVCCGLVFSGSCEDGESQEERRVGIAIREVSPDFRRVLLVGSWSIEVCDFWVFNFLGGGGGEKLGCGWSETFKYW